jgi:uncharacterized coiled-coil DUF342 family protein
MTNWTLGACWCGKSGAHNVGMGRDECLSQRRAVTAARKRAEAAQSADRNAAKDYWDERKRLKADISSERADMRSYEEGSERLSDEIYARQKAIADAMYDTTDTVTVYTDPPRTLPRTQETIDLLRAEIPPLHASRESTNRIITGKRDYITRERDKLSDMEHYPEKYGDPSLRDAREKADEALKQARKALDDCLKQNR